MSTTDKMVPTGAEVGMAGAAARAEQEVQASMAIAKRFPRNEDEARIKLIKACKRPSFAEEAEYCFPRGGNDVAGPSVYLAREAARVWGNIICGFEIIREDIDWRVIRCIAWDLETNTKHVQEDSFQKLIYRKKDGWIKPDERDLRELTNRRAAIGYRNCILQLIPKDITDEAMEAARDTLKNRAAQDPDAERKRIADAFAGLNVMPTQLETILGHPLAQASPEEIVTLRGIYKSIKDGNSTLAEYLPKPEGVTPSHVVHKTASRVEELKNRHSEPDPKNQPPAQSSAQESAATAAQPNTLEPPDPVEEARAANTVLEKAREEAGVKPRTEMRQATKGVPLNFGE